MKTSSRTVFSNVIWRFLERFGAQLVTFVVSIILARLLDPVVYGTVAIVSAIITILEVFINSGLGTALIQKKDADQTDFSTVFYFNITVAVVLYVVMFFVAPLFASFYNNETLKNVIRILCLVIIIYAFKETQYCYVARNLQFKKFFWSTSIGTILAAVVGVILAYKGFGVWALVAQTLLNNFIDTTILWIIVKWRPTKSFSFKRLKQILSFSWKLLASNLLDATYNEIRQFAIGKKYSSSDLAYFNRGKTLPSFLVTNINTSIDSVLLPTMSKEQEDKEKVKRVLEISIQVSCFIVFPICVGMAMCGESIIYLLLGTKWLPAAKFLKIFCFYFMFYPINIANANAIKAMGKTAEILKLEIVKKIVGIGAVFATLWISVDAVAYSLLFVSVFELIVNAIPNKKILNFTLLDLARLVIPNFIPAALMGLLVYMVSPGTDYGVITLIKQISVGAFTYFIFSFVFNSKSVHYIKNLLMSLKLKIGNRT